MRFEDFAALHGLIVGSLIEGRWVRVPTEDHPKKRNGAYKFLGDVGFVQNHATDSEVSVWKPEGEAPKRDWRQIHAQAAESQRKQREGWARATERALDLLATATPAEHGYLMLKGLKDVRGLVLPDETLMVPMRDFWTNDLVGAQIIRWLPDERRWDKKMLPGMRAKGAVFKLGHAQAKRTILCEGYATGLSIEAAAKQLRLGASVLVCFSDSNMVTVAPRVEGSAMVFADNDVSEAGERAARKTGLPYCMADTVGFDANDLHAKRGLFAVCAELVNVREPVS